VPLLPVLIGEPSGCQDLTPADSDQIKHLAEAGDVTTTRQDDGCLDSLARQDVLVVSGSLWEIGDPAAGGIPVHAPDDSTPPSRSVTVTRRLIRL
jgi:hypothetical protein